MQRIREALERFLAAEFRVDRVVVGDVVAVGRARPRLLDRRGVDVADPELGQIRQDRFGIREGEALVELQPVRRPRRRRGQAGRARARAAGLGRERGCELGKRSAGGGDGLQAAVELAPPVRIALGRARHIGLAKLGDHVFVLDRRQHRGRAGEVAGGGLEGRGLRRVVARQKLVGGERLGEANPLRDPADALGLGPLGVIEPERLAGIGVDDPPPADEGRQIVRGDGGQSIARIGGGRLEAAILLAFESEDAVAEDAGPHERIRKSLRGRAEIFRDDETLGAMALEPQHREHRLEGHGNIGAVAGRPGRRDQE